MRELEPFPEKMAFGLGAVSLHVPIPCEFKSFPECPVFHCVVKGSRRTWSTEKRWYEVDVQKAGDTGEGESFGHSWLLMCS